MSDIRMQLLTIDTDAIWRRLERDTPGPVPPQQVLTDFSEQVLDVYLNALSAKCVGWVCIAGVVPGFLAPIAARGQTGGIVPRQLERATAHRIGMGTPVRTLTPAEIQAIAEGTKPGDNALRISLVGFGELYGFIFLHCTASQQFSASDRELLRDSEITLNRLMADENFAMRLTYIAAPLEIQGHNFTPKGMADVVATRACIGFGVDGAIVRLMGPGDITEATLDVQGAAGLVPDELRVNEGPDENISRKVLESDEGISVQSSTLDGRREVVGTAVLPEDDNALRKLGVESYMVIRLQSDLHVGEQPFFGTLMILHNSPQVFSRRDVGLFRSFAERIADDFALLEQRDANASILKTMEAQDRLGTRAEITALLGHDFGHRVLSAQIELVDFVDACRKMIGEKKLPERLQVRSEKLLKATDELKQIVQQLRMLGQGVEEPSALFNVVDEEAGGKTVRGVFTEIHDTLSGPLERANMTLDAKAEGNCRVFGVRSVFVQVLYNLIINSIDAHRLSKNRKRNTVHILARELPSSAAARVVQLTIWDEGPGINRIAFPDEQKIFDVGTTSKPKELGTGTGLPVARKLLGNYFQADLQLKDRTKALFQFTLAVRTDRDKRQ